MNTKTGVVSVVGPFSKSLQCLRGKCGIRIVYMGVMVDDGLCIHDSVKSFGPE